MFNNPLSATRGIMLCGIAISIVAVLPAMAAVNKFKVTNVHFETNASACDMGIQVGFDTEGLTEGTVTDPNGKRIYSLKSLGGIKKIGGQTEGFLEGVEPQIKELMDALGCARTEEPLSTLSELFDAFPAGAYEFSGVGNGQTLEAAAKLIYHIPAGPKITAPAFESVVPAESATIRWKPVSGPIVPYLGPVSITGYHVIVEEDAGEVAPELDVDIAANETSLKVPRQFLKPATSYLLEVLSTDKSGNQTITEGYFCTEGVKSCKAPARRRKH
ncbi:MAG: fibronectin type III domain-containing protein [Alphaproteobacteria bacterium]|nr:fibronectin type III domain-containing protein [Alphaproteobacteria bacterium]